MSLPSVVTRFARFLGGKDPLGEQAAALAALATQAGHVCADLDCEAGWGPWAAGLDTAARAAFRARLPALDIVGGPDDWTPLVWDGRRLYLRRYFEYERRVAADVLARGAALATLDASDEARLADRFADAGQRAAARIALTHRLALISGGPGTGKTHTLARIIGLLQEADPDLRIALAAPTGKAAARMGEALLAAGVAVKGDGGGARTVHRLLGVRADGNGFRHHRARPLAVDVLVVDEASMIDLSLMAHLLDALPDTARLILLGDRDQLAAVEAGAVFADLCDSPRLASCVAPLTTSFRFGTDSGIGRLADRLRAGDATGALAQLQAGTGELVWAAHGAVIQGDQRALIDAAREGFGNFRQGVAAGLAAQELFARFDRFRVLCAHRQDAAALNRALGGASMRPVAGTPLMVLRNDALLRVFNGDIGLVLADPADGQLKACFPGDAGNAARWIALSRLPEWEPAWAMTVHKSQGSEFDQVLLALPDSVSPVATRELVYTGVTRAKRRVTLWGGAAVLGAAIESRAERMSGLRERLR